MVPPAPPGGREIRKRTAFDSNFLQGIKERTQKLFAVPGADPSGEFQVFAFVKAGEQGAEMFPRPFGLGIAANHEFLLLMELNFDPRSGSFPGFVPGIGALADQAFESQSVDPG